MVIRKIRAWTRLWRRTEIEKHMGGKAKNNTDQARNSLENRKRDGTHNPAAPCPVCSVLRTPGVTHRPPGKTWPTCAN